jgi:hypothetical protein
MTQKPLILALFAIACYGCKPKVDYKEKRAEVIKYHDAVMADAGNVADKQMQLNDMLKNLAAVKAKNPLIDTIKEKDSIHVVQERLNKADDAMSDWMHKFEPDVTGQSDEQAMAYFESEKLKIKHVDALFKQEIKFADIYLSKFKK